MRRIALPLLLASLSLAFAPAPLPRHERPEHVREPVEMARLAPADADRLAGRLLRYRVVLDSAPKEGRGTARFDCAHEWPGVMPSVTLPYSDGGEQAGDVLVVRARL